MSFWQRIVAAAVRLEGGLVVHLPKPARHHDILHAMHAKGLSTKFSDTEQGFLLSTGQYVNRESARLIAKNNSQCDSPRHPTELFSEDLW